MVHQDTTHLGDRRRSYRFVTQSPKNVCVGGYENMYIIKIGVVFYIANI